MINDPALMLRAMDAAGIDLACLSHPYHPDGTTGNNITKRFVAEHPDRFMGFAYVSPTMPERVIPELTRAIDDMGFVGIKLYARNTPWPIDERQWEPIYRFADERGLVVLFHTGSDPRNQPRLLDHIAARYPRARFVAGHSGNVAEQRAQALTVARRHSNVYLETSSTFRTPGVIEELVSEAGAERVLFGSDMPLMDPRPQLGKIITAKITEEQKRLILGSNARQLLSMTA